MSKRLKTDGNTFIVEDTVTGIEIEEAAVDLRVKQISGSAISFTRRDATNDFVQVGEPSYERADCINGDAADAVFSTMADLTTYVRAIAGKSSPAVVGVYQLLSEKGQISGYASLDGSGLVPSAQLPSYVDDVIEVADYASLPVTGETGKIYVTIDTGFCYRWTGSVYVQIAGDVTKVGTPVNNQVGVWTGDGTIEGDPLMVFGTSGVGILTIGQNDTTVGRIQLFGGGGNDGGQLQLFMGGGNDSVDQSIDIKSLAGGYFSMGGSTSGLFLTYRTTTGNLDLPTSTISMSSYGGGTITGTPTYSLAVDVSGNIIETAVVTGDVTKVGTPVNNQIGVWTGDGTIEGNTGLTSPSANTLDIGVSDTSQGLLRLYGSNTTVGAELRLYNGSSADGQTNTYKLKTGTQGQFSIFSDNDEFFTFKPLSGDQLALPMYGGGTITGTPTYTLNVDASGNIIEGAVATGLVNWTEAVNIAAPNATIPVVSFTATNGATNVDAAIIPKGGGAILASIPDNLISGGNKRGQYAVDLQMSRSTQSEVASGLYSTIIGGQYNTASGEASVAGGYFNVSSGGRGSIALGRDNNATAWYTMAIGFNNTASGVASHAIGANNEASGTYAFAAGVDNFSRSMGENALGMFGTDYAPAGVSTYDASDRLLNIGNGTGTGARSDAFTILKSGSTTLHSYGGGTITGTETYNLAVDVSGNIVETALATGDVTKVGTPVNDQVGIWTGDGTIEGHQRFTYTDSSLKIGGSNAVAGWLTLEGTLSGAGGVLTIYGSGAMVGDDLFTISTGVGTNGDFIISGNSTGTFFNRNSTSKIITFNDYGGGTITGTGTYALAVDVSGNIIEEPLTIGDVVTSGSPSSNQVGIWTAGQLKGTTGFTSSSNGLVSFGINNNSSGQIQVFGNAGASGGVLDIYTGGATDDDDDYYRVNGGNGVFSLGGASTGNFLTYTSATQVIGTLGAITSDQSVANIDSTGNTALTTKEYVDAGDTHNHAMMYDEDNTDAYVVNATLDLHSYHTNALAGANLSGFTFDAGGAGTSFPIASIADGVATGVDIEVTTTGSHGLAVDDIVSHTNLADAAYTGIFQVKAIISATQYEVAAVYTATGTGTMDQAATLESEVAGTIEISWGASATSATSNEIFDWQLMKNASHIIGSKSRRKFGTGADYGEFGKTALVTIAVGDKISFAFANNDTAGNTIIRNFTLVITEL